MTAQLSIRAELAGAVRAVNAAYARLPEDRRPESIGFDALDRELDAACAGDDRRRAIAAIDRWRWLDEFDRRARA